MSLACRLAGLALAMSLASCAADVTPPPPGDLAGFTRPTSPNTALAAPAGFVPTPDTVTKTYAVPPDDLYASVRRVMMARPRVTELAIDAPRRRADFVERSMILRFPDLVQTQVLPAGNGRSALVVFSRSEYGKYDFGVNGKRVAAILASIDAAVP